MRDPVSERMKFVSRLREGERMTDLCREFGISRKTGYKLAERYDRLGPIGLYDLPRRPEKSPRRVPDAVRQLVINIRKEHPSWGPKKIQEVLRRKHSGLVVP